MQLEWLHTKHRAHPVDLLTEIAKVAHHVLPFRARVAIPIVLEQSP